MFSLFYFSTDYTSGFGGKFGVQTDRVDKAAVGWDYKAKLEKHESQKGKVISLAHRLVIQEQTLIRLK